MNKVKLTLEQHGLTHTTECTEDLEDVLEQFEQLLKMAGYPTKVRYVVPGFERRITETEDVQRSEKAILPLSGRPPAKPNHNLTQITYNGARPKGD